MSVCPYCKKEMDPGLDSCPHCGITMVFLYKCKRCDQEFSATGILRFCPLCDADLTEQLN